MALLGINHIVLKVRNLEEARSLLPRNIRNGASSRTQPNVVLPCREASPRFSFSRSWRGALLAPQSQATGLFHICFNVSDEQALAQLHDRCKSFGVTILGTVDHTITRSFYVLDPDRNVIELGVDVPQEEWAHLSAPFSRDVAYYLPN